MATDAEQIVESRQLTEALQAAENAELEQLAVQYTDDDLREDDKEFVEDEEPGDGTDLKEDPEFVENEEEIDDDTSNEKWKPNCKSGIW